MGRAFLLPPVEEEAEEGHRGGERELAPVANQVHHAGERHQGQRVSDVGQDCHGRALGGAHQLDSCNQGKNAC